MSPQEANTASSPTSSSDAGTPGHLFRDSERRRVTFVEAPQKLERVVSAEEWQLAAHELDMDEQETPLHRQQEHAKGERAGKGCWRGFRACCSSVCLCPADLESGRQLQAQKRNWKWQWNRQHSQDSLGSRREERSVGGRRRREMWLRQQLVSPVLVTRLIMMVLLVIVTVVLSLGTWYATGIAYNNAVDSITGSLREEITGRTVEQFSHHLQRARHSPVVFASVLETLLVNSNASSFSTQEMFRTVSPLLWNFFSKAMEDLTSVSYAELDGRFVTYQLNPNGTYLVFSNESITDVNTLKWYSQPVDLSSGKPTSPAILITRQNDFDLQYITPLLALAKPVAWDLTMTRQGPSLLAVLEIPSTTMGSPGGLAAMASNMSAVNTFLRCQLGATIYVENNAGYLVASSSKVLNYDNSTGKDTLINTTAVTDPTISAAAMYLHEKYGGHFLLNQSIAISDVSINGVNSYINTAPLSIDNLELYVVVVVSKESLIGSINSERKRVLVIESLCAVGVLLLGWAVIIFVTLYVSLRMRPKEELLRQQEATQRAQTASEVKSQFLANISHDLRTPMAGILGLLDIMLCDRLTAEQEANLRQMKSCAASLLGLLNNLLDLAKVEAGKMQLEVLEFDIVGELESLVDMFSVQGLSNGTEIALDLSDDIERTVKGDPSRVRQVFANLLSNACKFTKEGHVLVRGWMQRSPPLHLLDRTPRYSDDSRESDGKRRITYIFEVDDTGPGIPPHKRELVFEKFQQADLSTTRTHGGTGLGLGIVRSLVKLMGGAIAVVDKEGPGACFRFDLTFECLDQTSKWKNSIVQPEFLLPKLSSVEGGQVLLAMKESSAGAVIATGWMERRGLHVWRVTQWEDIPQAVNSMVAHRANGARGSRSLVGFSAPLDRKPARGTGLMNAFSGPLLHNAASAFSGPLLLGGGGGGQAARLGTSVEEPAPRSTGLISEELGEPARLILAIIDASLIPNPFQFLAEELHIFRAKLQAQGVVIAWLVEHNTTAETRRALRRSGCAVASKPLYASRMAPLLALATARKGIPHTSSSVDPARSQGSMTESWQAETTQSFMLPGPVEEAVEDKQVDSGQRGAAEAASERKGTPPRSPSQGPKLRLQNADPSSAAAAAGGGFREGHPPAGPPANGESGDSSPSGSAAFQPRPPPTRIRSLSTPKKPIGPGSPVASYDLALKGLHVLIAEDTPLLKKVAVIRMQKLGCTVVAVSDGKEAADLVLSSYKAAAEGSTEKMFDAILMDCQMPVLDGYGATQMIREAEKGTPYHTPIIALTAHAMTSDERKCLDAGMDAYLTKPIDPALMASTILNLVRPKMGDGDGNGGNTSEDGSPPISPSNFACDDTPQSTTTRRGTSEVSGGSGRLRRPDSVMQTKERYAGKT